MAELRAPDRDSYSMYIEVEKEYERYLTPELSDGYVVTCLLWAMERGLYIVCEAPMSERLYYQLTEYFIPVISNQIEKYKHIKL